MRHQGIFAHNIFIVLSPIAGIMSFSGLSSCIDVGSGAVVFVASSPITFQSPTHAHGRLLSSSSASVYRRP
ncbi:hypothetical protein DFH29DRAFT_931001 [Suillus ampliporus]|nr:hypothetical protein DFH29DRAFT_931001 [Suillus ampliporus]